MKKYLSLVLAFLCLQVFAQEFPIATGSYSQTYPSSAFANGNYYNAFLDKSTGGSAYGFHGKFINHEGTVFPEDIEIVAPISKLSFMHEIIWGQSNYLFVWSRGVSGYDRDAYGQLVGEDGNPTGSMFAISVGNTESASFVEAAFNGENYFIIWQEGMPNGGSIIRAQFVDQEGQLVGSNFSIRPDDLAEDVDQIYPDVEFDGDKFLVVWDDNRSGNRDIYGQFVSTSGELLGEGLVITNHSADQLLVQLAFGGSNYYVVWGDERLSSNDKSIFGQLIGMDGQLLGDNLSISPQTNSEGRNWPDVAASNDEYLVVWDQEWLEYKEGSDSHEGIEVIKYEAAGVGMPKPTVWYDIYARKISFQGEYISGEMAICTMDYHQQDCDVASDGNDFLISWSDSRNGNQFYDIYGYVVEGSALPQLLVISPDTINFICMNQFLEGGENFTITNTNDFEISIDDISFNAPEQRYWYLSGSNSFPMLLDGGASVEFLLNMDLPVGKDIVPKSFETDTLLVHTMNSEVMLFLNIDEALLDTIFILKKEYTQDSLYFQTVDQALFGLDFGIINRHLGGIYIWDAWATGPYGLWEINPEYTLPFVIYFGDTLDIHVSTMLPVLNEYLPDVIGIDTLWFASWGDLVYSFPLYYETGIIDSIWTGLELNKKKPEFKVYPNPAKDVLYVNVDDVESVTKVELLDYCGRIVKTISIDEVSPLGFTDEINIQDFMNGVYLLKVYTYEGAFTTKFIIHH